ncbi:hypothetical protein Tco_0581924 [Tanacetum coccineum]
MPFIITDRKNLATASRGKKKTAHLLIPSVRFVRKDGRAINGDADPDALLLIYKEHPKYDKYLEHVAKYQQYLDAEHGMEDEGGATESPKATKVTKPKAAKVTKPVGDKAPKPTSSQPPKPTPAQTEPSKKDQSKKRKPVKETSDAPSPHQKQKENVPHMIKRKPSTGLELMLKEQGNELSTGTTNGNLENRLSGENSTATRCTRKGKRESHWRTHMPTKSSGHAESPSLDAELALTDSQAGPNPVKQDEGQAGSNPGDAAESQPQSSHVVHARINLEHMDSKATDASTQQNIEQMDEELTTTALSNNVQSMVTVPIHQDTLSVPPMTSPVIDLTVLHPVSIMIHALLPTSTATARATTITTSLPPPPPQPQQSTTDPILVGQTWVPAVQIGESKYSPASEQSKLKVLFIDAIGLGNAKLLFKLDSSDLPTVEYKGNSNNKEYLDEARTKKRKIHESPRTPPGSPHSQPPPPAGASGAPGTFKSIRICPLVASLPSSSSINRTISGYAHNKGNRAPSSSKTAASTHQSMPWTTSNTRYESTGFTAIQETSSLDDLMHDDSIPDEHVHLSDDEDSRNDQLPKDNVRKDWWKPLTEEERPATPKPAWTIPSFNVDMTTFINWYCRKVNKTVLTQADFEGQAYEVVKAFYPDVVQLQVNVNRPLPLGGPPGHVTIQKTNLLNKDMEYLRYDSKGSSPALSISKMKAASYPDFGLELLVPEQMWIDDVCTYDISAKYGISHWWFNQQKFYIDRHDSLSRRKDVRTHMRILSVVRIKAYSRYGYDYLSKIVLRRADFQEHTIAEKDFKNLYPSNFEDLNLLLLQGHLDHPIIFSATNIVESLLKQDGNATKASNSSKIIPSLRSSFPRAVVILEWNSGDDQLRLRWIIYLVVLADAAESVRDAIRFEYCLASSSGWTNIQCAPFEALYGRKCRSPVLWAEIGESSLTGLELVQEMTNKVVLVKEKPKAARDHQKSYVNYRRKPLEFEVGDRVLLKVTSWKGVVHFGKKGKLAPRYVEPFEILERIGLVAYRLRLPEELNSVHDTFHMSNLKKCLADANLHVPLDEIKVDKTLRFVKEL